MTKSEVKMAINSCPHEKWEAVRVWDSDYFSQGMGRIGSPVFVGKICAVCDFFIKRRPGNKFVVCHNCGGDMKSKRRKTEPDQSGFMSVYACEECGHEAGHI